MHSSRDLTCLGVRKECRNDRQTHSKAGVCWSGTGMEKPQHPGSSECVLHTQLNGEVGFGIQMNKEAGLLNIDKMKAGSMVTG